MGLEDYLFVIKRIAASVSLPCQLILKPATETPEEISAAITRLSELGVAGINIEDSVVVNGKGASSMLVFCRENKTHHQAVGCRAHKNVYQRTFRFLFAALPNAWKTLDRVDAYQNRVRMDCFLLY